MVQYDRDATIYLDEYESFDVIVNKKLRVHICRNDQGYNVDLYKERKNVNDSDYISTCTAWNNDLQR